MRTRARENRSRVRASTLWTASLTAAAIRSSSISLSSPISPASMRTERTSCRPVIVILTMPAPASPSTSIEASSLCACCMSSCSFCACFINSPSPPFIANRLRDRRKNTWQATGPCRGARMGRRVRQRNSRRKQGPGGFRPGPFHAPGRVGRRRSPTSNPRLRRCSRSDCAAPIRPVRDRSRSVKRSWDSVRGVAECRQWHLDPQIAPAPRGPARSLPSGGTAGATGQSIG